MRILNLEDALLLYDLIGKHIPKIIAEDENILNFVGKIIDNIIEANDHKRYIDALVLFTGMTQEEILNSSLEDNLLLFSEGLVKNHILLLCKFCEELGYGSSR